jgi:hypothetical protein
MKGTFAIDLNGVVAVVTGAATPAARFAVVSERRARRSHDRAQRSWQTVGAKALQNTGRDGRGDCATRRRFSEQEGREECGGDCERG